MELSPRLHHPAQPLTISVDDAARILGVSRSHVYELCASDDLPCIHLGRRILVLRRPLLALLAADDPALDDPPVNDSHDHTDLPHPQSGSGGNHYGGDRRRPW